ncbi:hypothetical protein FRC11_009639 [Ceratobasidium sp. 423]|nr:hypothetical protein FRC11_009639 [Ceratobasidium sp. 423]
MAGAAPGTCQVALNFLEQYQLPGIGAITDGDHPSAPAFYQAKDVNCMAFGIWMTTYKGKIVTDVREIQANIHGGQFFSPHYGIAIKFNHCGAMTGVTWPAPKDQHATTSTETADPKLHMLGSAVQLAEGVFEAYENIAVTGRDMCPNASACLSG